MMHHMCVLSDTCGGKSESMCHKTGYFEFSRQTCEYRERILQTLGLCSGHLGTLKEEGCSLKIWWMGQKVSSSRFAGGERLLVHW